MALVIELVSAGKVIDGYETWWDTVDLAIERSSLSFPVLERVDPYGIVRIDGEDLGRMAEELGALPAPAPPQAGRPADRPVPARAAGGRRRLPPVQRRLKP